MRYSLSISVLLFTALILGTTTTDALANGSGSWQYAGDDVEREAMEASLERATSELMFPVRHIARNRLEDVCQPWETLRIKLSDDRVWISTNASEGTTSKLGSPLRKESDDGKVVIRRFMQDDTLVETIAMERGTRTNRYIFGGEWVRVDTTIESPRLASPVRFTYTYR